VVGEIARLPGRATRGVDELATPPHPAHLAEWRSTGFTAAARVSRFVGTATDLRPGAQPSQRLCQSADSSRIVAEWRRTKSVVAFLSAYLCAVR